MLKIDRQSMSKIIRSESSDESEHGSAWWKRHEFDDQVERVVVWVNCLDNTNLDIIKSRFVLYIFFWFCSSRICDRYKDLIHRLRVNLSFVLWSRAYVLDSLFLCFWWLKMESEVESLIFNRIQVFDISRQRQVPIFDTQLKIIKVEVERYEVIDFKNFKDSKLISNMIWILKVMKKKKKKRKSN